MIIIIPPDFCSLQRLIWSVRNISNAILIFYLLKFNYVRLFVFYRIVLNELTGGSI